VLSQALNRAQHEGGAPYPAPGDAQGAEGGILAGSTHLLLGAEHLFYAQFIRHRYSGLVKCNVLRPINVV
jgi:hypothetical protein